MKHNLLFLLLLLAQASFAQTKSGPVKVISATVQNWLTGAAPGKAGITYTIKVKLLSKKPVTFKTLWIGKDEADFDVQTFLRDPSKKPGKGDSVLIVHTKITKPATPASDNKPAPFEYAGAALLQYTVAGKTHYFIISKLDSLHVIKGM